MKTFGKILLVVFVLILLAVGGFYVLLRLAFGPITTTYEIETESGQTLICEETYNADMAAVFCDIKFYLEGLDSNTFIGKGFYNRSNWQESVTTFIINDWLFVKTENTLVENELKLIGLNLKTKNRMDKIFSAGTLTNDSVWQRQNESHSTKCEVSEARLDSVSGKCIFVTFKYRNLYPNPPDILSATFKYSINNQTGKLETEEIF